MIPHLTIRLIQPDDNAMLSSVIKGSLELLDAAIDGTVYTDKATDYMSEQYTEAGSAYYVAILDNILVGGAGLKKVPGTKDETVCELQRMFIHHRARGQGIANILIEQCIKTAQQFGYKQMYLETMPRMTTAIALYTKHGFQHIDHSMGNTGHFSCDVFMLKQL